MSAKIKAIVYEEINKVSIREDIEMRDCGRNEILCETLYTFVSPGTELRVLGGYYSTADEFPLIPGYSVVSRVIKTGTEVRGFKVGDIVSGRNPVPDSVNINIKWGGQASRHIYKVTGEDRPVLLPERANPLDYVITEVSAISFRGVEAANPTSGETAVVIGQGMIGAFSASWLKDRGCRVIVCDICEQRLRKAMERGMAAAVNMSEKSAVDRLKVLCNEGTDIVVESSGTTQGVKTAYQLIRKKPQAYGEEYKVEPIAFYHGDWPRLIMQANYQDSSWTANINTGIFNVKRSTLSMPSSSQYDCRHFLYGQSCTNP